MQATILCALALLLGAPAQAATRADAPGAAAVAAPRSGALGRGAEVLADGRAYATTGATQVFDRKGAPLAAPRLVPGRSVAFTVDANYKVRQLWLLD
jgi:hypothetical protein